MNPETLVLITDKNGKPILPKPVFTEKEYAEFREGFCETVGPILDKMRRIHVNFAYPCG